MVLNLVLVLDLILDLILDLVVVLDLVLDGLGHGYTVPAGGRPPPSEPKPKKRWLPLSQVVRAIDAWGTKVRVGGSS